MAKKEDQYEIYDEDAQTEGLAPEVDAVGQYPADTHVPPLEGRRYLWTSRAFAVALYLSLLVNFVLGLGLYTAWNFKEIIPMMVTFEEAKSQFVKVEPIPRSLDGLELMTEKLVGEYVAMREEIVQNYDVMRERFSGYIASRTSEEAFKGFIEEKSRTWKQVFDAGLNRHVAVEDVYLDPTKSYFVVDYKLQYMDQEGTVRKEEPWKAFLTVKYEQRDVRYEDRYLNPLGFTVVGYSQQPRTGTK